MGFRKFNLIFLIGHIMIGTILINKCVEKEEYILSSTRENRS